MPATTLPPPSRRSPIARWRPSEHGISRLRARWRDHRGSEVRVIAIGLNALMLSALVPGVGSENTPAQIERGRYLATAGDCIACHTQKGGAPFVGGLPIETPFGTIYSANLTPDPETGLGRWTNDDFYRALHQGI